jgi:hypothetical protein
MDNPLQEGFWQCWKDSRSQRHHSFMVRCASVAWSLCNSIGFVLQCVCTIPLPNATVPRWGSKVLQADMQLSSKSPACWSSHILSAMEEGLTQSYMIKQKLLICEPIDLSQFVVDLRDRHLEFWAPFSNKPPYRAQQQNTYHQWCAVPAQRALVTHPSYRLPRYILLDLP